MIVRDADPNHSLVPGNLPHFSFPTAFGTEESQTRSFVVNRHLLRLLDEPAAGAFGPLIPPVLSSADLLAIEDAARDGCVQVLAQIRSGTAGAVGLQSPGDTFGLSLLGLPDYPQLGAVQWLGLVFGEGDNAFHLTPDAERTTNAIVTIDPAFSGDLVVSASYETIGHQRVFAQPSLVFTREPAGATLDGLEVYPAEATFETGEEIKPQWRAVYSDGRRLERWVRPDEFTMVSSRPKVVLVTPHRTWKAIQPGAAVVTLSWRGFSTPASLTVSPPPPSQTFEEWRATHFTAEELAIPEISAPTSDPDADGFNNILEFTSAGNPLVITSPHRPAIVWFDLEGGREPALQFELSTTLAGVRVRIEESADLRTWITHCDVPTEGTPAPACLLASEDAGAFRLLTVRLEAVPACTFYRIVTQILP